MEILNVGLGEMVVILVIALLVFGPERLPEVARRAGKTLRDLQAMSSEVTQVIQQSMAEVEEPIQETRDTLRNTQKSITDEVDRTANSVARTQSSTPKPVSPPSPEEQSDGAPSQHESAEAEVETTPSSPVTDNDDDNSTTNG